MVPPARYDYVRSNVAFILCVAIPPHTYEISSARSFRSMFINKLIHCQHLGCLKERTLIEHGLHVSDGNHLKIIPIPITNPNQFIQKQLGSPTLQKEWLRGWPAVCGGGSIWRRKTSVIRVPRRQSLLQAQFGPSPVSPFGVVPKTKAVEVSKMHTWGSGWTKNTFN